jgi:ABC-type uncharacterized transport system fused permease/ATPase subunit
MYFVPQRPFMSPEGTLREQLIYPLSVLEAQKRRGSLEALDAELKDLMRTVRLHYLLEREGGLGAKNEWGEVMSLGEQQRMGLARMFFARPHFGVLDDATNAISVETESSLYSHAKVLGISVITMSTRPALLSHHDFELRLSGTDGGWELLRMDRSNFK